jgi:hypothetical protein
VRSYYNIETDNYKVCRGANALRITDARWAVGRCSSGCLTDQNRLFSNINYIDSSAFSRSPPAEVAVHLSDLCCSRKVDDALFAFSECYNNNIASVYYAWDNLWDDHVQYIIREIACVHRHFNVNHNI